MYWDFDVMLYITVYSMLIMYWFSYVLNGTIVFVFRAEYVPDSVHILRVVSCIGLWKTDNLQLRETTSR